MSTLRPISYEETQQRLGLTEKEVKSYSIGRMVQSLVPGSSVEAGLEQEASAAIAKKCSRASKGFFVHYEVLTRNLCTKVESFAVALRNKMVVAKAGANIIPQLRENISIPTVTTDPTVGWISEGAGAPESNSTFGQVPMSPKMVSGYTQLSRQLALQVEPEVLDGVIINSLTRALAIAVDWAALSGTGTDGNPLGVINTPGIGTTSGASIAWANITGMEKTVLNANANEDTFAYVCHPNVRDLLKNRPKIGSTYPEFICSGDNRINGYPCFATKQVADGLLIGGDFSQIYVAEWGALDILVNPYTINTGSTIGITAFDSVDTALVFPAAFNVATGVN
jgi:hypothetical protein